MAVQGIDPANRTSPKLAARQWKEWLDEGRPVTLLDTRNDYEVKLGTFKNALPIGMFYIQISRVNPQISSCGLTPKIDPENGVTAEAGSVKRTV